MSDKTKNIVITFLFMTIFIGFFLFNVLTPAKEVSSSERRSLKQFPQISWKRVIETDFMADFDDYVLDQFIFRDQFRRIKAKTELNLLNKKDINDLFVYKGFIFKKLYPLDEDSVIITTNRMKQIEELYLANNNIFYTIIPDKNYYLDDSLGYLKLDYRRLETIMNNNLPNMRYINIFDTLSLDSYYRTDIHFRQEKLDPLVLRLGSIMNFSVPNLYEKRTIPNFKGSYFGQLALNLKPEEIIYLTNNTLERATVFSHESGKYNPIYDLSKVEGIDKYDIFLSGPQAILDIYNPLAKTNKELIIFRDSFGSSLIPLLINDYKNVTVIDTRYVGTHNLGKFVEFKDQDVLFMYSVNLINSGAILR